MRLRIVVLSLLTGLVGCSHLKNQEAAPVVSIEARHPITKGQHTVKAGETLYAIAFQYGHDYRELAATNHIPPPYRIYPGQKIALKGQFTIATKAPHKVKPGPTSIEIVKHEKNKPAEVAKFPVKPSQPVVLAGGWTWPVKGKVIKGFSTKEYAFNKGVDIAGTLGTPVLSAQSGKVVYSGGGLRGYGQLIIIKHNDTFLSAYAHNQRLLVKEGDTIAQGQKIAEMGQSDTDRVKLHFEIRKNGQPVNPLHFLPKTV